jgi:hypothetical protein
MSEFVRATWLVLLVVPSVALGAGRKTDTPPSGDGARPAGPVQATRELVLDEKASGKVFGLRTARGVLTTIEFPEDIVGRPACGDCEDGQGPEGDALYRLEVSGQGRYMTLRPNAAARRGTNEDTSTTILVRLEHSTLTLYVEQTERPRADTRVVFKYPGRDADTEYLRVERAKIEAEVAAKAENALTARFLRAFAEPHACVQRSARIRNDDVVLEVREMCYFGREVILTFSVENRGSTPFEIGSVVVNKGTNKREYVEANTISDHPSTGVVALRLTEGDQVKGPYELALYERGGKSRVVSLGKLEF